MKNCKRERPLMSHDESECYQTPTDCSDEELQRSCEFVKKLKTLDDKRIFQQFVCAIKTYQSCSFTYIDLKDRIVSILRNHQDLLREFFSGSASPARNFKKPKQESEIVRISKFLNKLQALGESNVYKAFIGALGFSDDIEAFIEQLDDVFRDQTCLKEEFKTFLIDSRLFKPKQDLDPVTENVTPSYRIRPDYVEGSSSSNEVLNDKYYSVGDYDPDPEKVVETRKRPWRELRMDDHEDRLLEEDLLLSAIGSVIRFWEDDMCDTELCNKLPLGFKRVLRWFHQGREAPEIFKTDPKNAVRGILPRLQSIEMEMKMAKECRATRLYNRVEARGIVNRE